VAAFALWASLTPSVTSVSASGRVAAAPGVLPVVAATAGIAATPIAAAGDIVAVGDTVAGVRTADGVVPVIADQAGTVWQVGVIPGEAVTPGSSIVSLLPPGSDRSVILAIAETSVGAIRPGLAVNIGGAQAVSGTVMQVSAPISADDASARTGLALAPGMNYSLITVDTAAPLQPGAAVDAQIILSDSTVIGRLLGES
jgi:multidrug resistance efflux pump